MMFDDGIQHVELSKREKEPVLLLQLLLLYGIELVSLRCLKIPLAASWLMQGVPWLHLLRCAASAFLNSEYVSISGLQQGDLPLVSME